jgi:hypothetical protein
MSNGQFDADISKLPSLGHGPISDIRSRARKGLDEIRPNTSRILALPSVP